MPPTSLTRPTPLALPVRAPRDGLARHFSLPTAPADETHVCGECPGASDANDGAAHAPVKSITRGISLAMARASREVRVAGGLDGRQLAYAEDLVIPDGLSLAGGWQVRADSGTLTWMANAPPQLRAKVSNVSARGVFVKSVVPSRLSGISVEVAPSQQPAGIFVAENAVTVLSDIEVRGGSTLDVIGIHLKGSAELYGVSIDVRTVRVGVGLYADRAKRLVWNGGHVRVTTDIATGVQFNGGLSHGASISDLNVRCQGRQSAVAVSASYCRGASSQPIVFERSRLVGGFADTGVATAIGVRVQDDCPVRVTTSDVIGADVLAPQARATAVECSRCTIERSRIIGALARPMHATGVTCYEHCTLTDNLILGGEGWSSPGLLAVHGRIERNVIRAEKTAVYVWDSVDFINNVIVGGEGAVALAGGPWDDAPQPVSTFISNTIQGGVGVPGNFISNILIGGGEHLQHVSIGNDILAADGGIVPVSPANFSLDPRFAVFPHLSASSPLRGRGPTDAGVPPTDFEGDRRHSPPDIGADEVP